ncbi:DNA repair protein RecO [Thalassotalea sp. PLHSN55]|uniref:DNA repair protein RecO n=1 Tax=Thalassotalea sp. PLHSN55 TaxID=3435888 RepID=UPI003F85D4FC
MNFNEQAAFLLHSRPYREHQVIVELLTEHDGKVAAISYLGRTPKSNKKGLLQPFLPLTVLLKGKGNLKNLSRVEAQQKSYPLTGNFLYSGFYLNELLVRLLGEHISCNGLFEQYNKSIQGLANQQPIEQILRQFEAFLLDELGLCFDYSPLFSQQAKRFYYLPEQGFVPVLESSSQPSYLTEHLQAIAQSNFDSPEVLLSYKLLMRQVINHLLGGQPLNSRKLFKK